MSGRSWASYKGTSAFVRPVPRLVAPSNESIARGCESWHDCGMTRIRVSTTVDESLIAHARELRSGLNDAALIDEALGALVARYRAAEIDEGYAAYAEHPLDEADEWGDLASFHEAAASS